MIGTCRPNDIVERAQILLREFPFLQVTLVESPALHRIFTLRQQSLNLSSLPSKEAQVLGKREIRSPHRTHTRTDFLWRHWHILGATETDILILLRRIALGPEGGTKAIGTIDIGSPTLHLARAL